MSVHFPVQDFPSHLAQAAVNQWWRVAPQANANPRLLALGFLPHERVRVLRRSWLPGGALVVQLGNATFALRSAEAAQIDLEPEA
jgi:Fe2+ transport system protein FeoA